ncbi:putative transcriptional regulator [Mariprofundus aestuarium]|uniref:Putative transcriptional regulator n=1 Tax=Mariprofundus aestuarium TaxID=1921086 RepID=A0A2K8L585_MARES|nr:BlaI/MecI/CopY family transcriptional regulator [Mariprofundus aestuarium]ATX80154.1 putative transcriptional regulator [Mariprofundus aestuarium]
MLPVKRQNLGELEMAVLEHLWTSASGDAKGVHKSIGTQRGISLNTIQSTLERLFRKQLLKREKISHSYVYSPSVQRGELMTQLIDDVVKTLSGGKTDYLLSAFIDYAAREDESSLDRLEQLIAQRRADEPSDKNE